MIPNADDGGATNLTINSYESRYIKNWTDTKIEVLVADLGPGGKPMGSGMWQVVPSLNLFCSEQVDVEYALQNLEEGCPASCEEGLTSIATNTLAPLTSFKWYLDFNSIDMNPKITSQGINSSMVKDICEMAFCEWETKVNLEFDYAGDNSNGLNSGDQKYTISFGNSLSSSILATTHLEIRNLHLQCDASTYPNINSRIFDSDIELNENKKWFVSSSTSGISSNQYDLYSVLVHEIGHMISLEHAMDTDGANGTKDDRIMYYSIEPKQIKRYPDNKSIKGVLEQKTRTKAAMATSCLSGYTLNESISGCGATSTDELIENTFYYNNPAIGGSILNIEAGNKIMRLKIFSIQGELLFENTDINSNIFNLNISNFKPGIYLLNAKIKDHWITKKLIVL